MKLPLILQQSLLSPTEAKLELKLQPELMWFKGHFPEQPILPGVTQLTWVIHYAKNILNVNGGFTGCEVIKFQKPLIPNDIVTLSLNWQSEKKQLNFEYYCQQLVASSGRIKL